MSKLFGGTRKALKPFEYPWADEAYKQASKMHWVPADTSLEKDMRDWLILNQGERNLLEKVFVFLANADTDIASNYVDKLIPAFPLPELRGMLITFAAMEAIHTESYAYTLDQLGFPGEVYSRFLDIKEMFEKHVFVTQQRTENLSDEQKLMLDLAINSIFGEGVMLFSAFVMILAFEQRGLMLGAASLTKYIVRDEEFHCQGMTKIFNTMVDEAPESATQELLKYIIEAGEKAVELENHFIDLAFQLGDIVNLKKEDLKQYIKYIANKRMNDARLPLLFPEVKKNPLPWTDIRFGASTKTNNFERDGVEYQKANLSGNWNQAKRASRPLPDFVKVNAATS